MQVVTESADDEFFAFCQANPDHWIERTAQGEIVILPGTGWRTSCRNTEICSQVHVWAKRDGRGRAFESSGEVLLPSGAARIPNASWVARDRLAALTAEQQDKFLPLCPDFVIELRSPSDRLAALHAKMREWIDNGAQLAWLIDPDTRTVFVYRPDHAVAEFRDASEIAAGAPVDRFVLDLGSIWETTL